MSERRKDQTCSGSSAPNSSKVVNDVCEHRENISITSKTPEAVNICEQKIKARKQFTHLPVDLQATFAAIQPYESVPKCDECAVLEDIVANKCEKCLFAQELASRQPSRKSSETKNLSENVCKTPETVNLCEHQLKARKQFTHLPVDSQATFDALQPDEDAPKCDECAVLEDIVANKCEKCLFAQELACRESSRENSDTKNLPGNSSKSENASLKKKRAPPLPAAPRTETEAELLVCPPISTTNQQKNKEENLKLASEKTIKEDTTKKNMPLSAMVDQRADVEVFKRGNKKSQFAGSNVYVIQPTFKQIIRPLAYQASNGLQCEKLKKASPKRKNYSAKFLKKDECYEDSDAELNSESNQKSSDLESSSDQEEEKKLKARKKSKSRNQTNGRKRSVSIQCRIPKDSRSKSSSRPKSTRSKSVGSSKTKSSYQRDLNRSSLSDIFIGPTETESESLLNSKDDSSILSTKPRGSVESDTQIIIEEKIYVKCPTDSIRRKKITTGNKSILSGKSLAADIRSLLCDAKSSGLKSSSLNDQPIKDETKLTSHRTSTHDKKCPSPEKKLNFKDLPSYEEEICSNGDSVSTDKISSHVSEHSDSESSQSDHKPEQPSDINHFDHSRVSDEKYACFDKKSTRSNKNKDTGILKTLKTHSSYESGAPEQSESDFCTDFHKKINHSQRNESHEPDEKCVCFDEESIVSYKHTPSDTTKNYSFYGSEASEQSESDFCAPFRKGNENDHFNKRYNEDYDNAELDSEYDLQSCSEVDSNYSQSHHSAFAGRDVRTSEKPSKTISQHIDIEAGKESRSVSRRRTHSDSRTSVLFRTNRISQTSCTFIFFIILIIIFFVAMLAWRIIKHGK